MTWVDCTTLDVTAINGFRFSVKDTVTPWYFNRNFPSVKRLFSQVPFVAVADPITPTTTTTRWSATEITRTDFGSPLTTTIVGSILQIKVEADRAQVQPQENITYTVTPQISQAAGTFSPVPAPALTITNTIDKAVTSLNFANLDPFWTYEITPADFGPDGAAYTADDVRSTTVTFKPANPENITTETVLPPITYVAKTGINLPPSGILNNDVVISETYAEASKKASVPITATTPEAAFFEKRLISQPQIEVEDPENIWQIEWVNYNNYSLGKGVFVDVFPYNGDQRDEPSKFTGTSQLKKITRIGSAALSTTKYELTTATPVMVNNPADGPQKPSIPADATWTLINPDDPDSWPVNATAIRVTLDEVKAAAAGYGAFQIHLGLSDNAEGDIYDNDATGTVFNPNEGRTVDLGRRYADHVEVVASSISGVAWIDADKNGLRENTEKPIPNVTVYLHRVSEPFGWAKEKRSDWSADNTLWATTKTDAQGAYRFENLRHGEYYVVFDKDELERRGYAITDQLVDPTQISIDSDADPADGRTATEELPVNADLVNIDAGVYLKSALLTEIEGQASLDRVYDWSIVKNVVDADAITVNDEGKADITYKVDVTAGTPTDQNHKFIGTVKVTNPSDLHTYIYTAQLSADGNSLTCTITDGQNREIAPGIVQELAYECTGNPGSDLERELTLTLDIANKDASAATPPPATNSATVAYEVTEKNTSVNVSDEFRVGEVTDTQSFGPYQWAAAGEVFTETYTKQVEVPAGSCVAVTNTATIIEIQKQGSTEQTICAPTDLEITNTAVTSLTKTYGWNIEKNLTNPDVTLDKNGNAELTYEVTVTELEREDANWKLDGEISVRNPNTYKAVDATISVSTDLEGEAVCEPATGDTVTIQADDTRTIAYSCTFASEPKMDGTASVQVTWMSDNSGVSRTLLTPRTVTADSAVTEDQWEISEFTKTVSVVDTLTVDNASEERTFGPYTWNEAGTMHTETYSVPVRVEPGTCVDVSNAALLDGAGLNAQTQNQFCREPLPVVAKPTTSARLSKHSLARTGVDTVLLAGASGALMLLAAGSLEIARRKKKRVTA